MGDPSSRFETHWEKYRCSAYLSVALPQVTEILHQQEAQLQLASLRAVIAAILQHGVVTSHLDALKQL